MKMEFKGLEKSSLIEWPGKVVAVAFTGGCNFRCPFCQNRDLVLNPEELPTINSSEIMEYLNSRSRWLDGLAITGGEPTLHSALPKFIEKVKGSGFETALETNGTNPDMIEELVEKRATDIFFIDIKAPLMWNKYKKAIGVYNEKLLENLKKSIEMLKSSNSKYVFRTTVVPKILGKENLVEIVDQIKGKTDNYQLQQFIPQNTLDEEYEEVEPFPEEELKKIHEKIKVHFKECKIRNL